MARLSILKTSCLGILVTGCEGANPARNEIPEGDTAQSRTRPHAADQAPFMRGAARSFRVLMHLVRLGGKVARPDWMPPLDSILFRAGDQPCRTQPREHGGLYDAYSRILYYSVTKQGTFMYRQKLILLTRRARQVTKAGPPTGVAKEKRTLFDRTTYSCNLLAPSLRICQSDAGVTTREGRSSR